MILLTPKTCFNVCYIPLPLYIWAEENTEASCSLKQLISLQSHVCSISNNLYSTYVLAHHTMKFYISRAALISQHEVHVIVVIALLSNVFVSVTSCAVPRKIMSNASLQHCQREKAPKVLFVRICRSSQCSLHS